MINKLGKLVEKTLNATPARFFVITSTIFGLLFLFITPPFQAPDEPVHFFRAYHISKGDPTVDRVGKFGGAVLPDSLEKIVHITANNPQIQFQPNHKYDVKKTYSALKITSDNSQRTYDFSTTAYYSPVSYIPQSTGIAIGRIVSDRPMLMFYAGRILNLMSWVVLFYYAIRLIPRRKWVVVFIGLLPMSLFQASSLSSDVMAIGILALFMTYILKLKQKGRVLTKQQITLVAMLATMLALSKQAMFIFLPLILMLPRAHFQTRFREYFTKTALICGPLIILGIWFYIAGKISFSTSVGGVNPGEQMRFILGHPYDFLNASWNTYFYSWGDHIVKSFVGNFGWVDTPLADIFVTAGYIALFILYFGSVKKTKTWLSRWEKVLLGILIVAYIGAVTSALYLYFTPVGFKIVNGLVGRYYLPVALLLIPIAYGTWLRVSSSTYRKVAIISPLLLLFVSIITLYVRYYVNNV